MLDRLDRRSALAWLSSVSLLSLLVLAVSGLGVHTSGNKLLYLTIAIGSIVVFTVSAWGVARIYRNRFNSGDSKGQPN